MCNKPDWNRREFIVKPIVWAGAAGMLARTGFLLGESAPAAVTGSVLQRTLGKTGIQLPVVSMGVMNADIPGLLRRAYELGIRHFDTAAVYQQGRNEEMVGSVIKELAVRNTVTISTKQPVRNYRQPDSEVKKRFIEGVEASLQRLQMDHVDILYYHAADSADAAKAQGPLPALVAFRNLEGLGVEGVVEGHRVVVGRRSMFDTTLEGTVIGAIDGAPVAGFTVADSVKPTSREAVAALRALGLRPML